MDQPLDEVEPLSLVEEEIERVIRHPRREAVRLHNVADAGESGATPLIEIAAVARYIVPLVLLVIGLIFGVYYAVRWAAADPARATRPARAGRPRCRARARVEQP